MTDHPTPTPETAPTEPTCPECGHPANAHHYHLRERCDGVALAGCDCEHGPLDVFRHALTANYAVEQTLREELERVRSIADHQADELTPLLIAGRAGESPSETFFRVESERDEARAESAALRERVAKLRSALEDIANTDYRGNRPAESVMAFDALREYDAAYEGDDLRAAIDAALSTPAPQPMVTAEDVAWLTDRVLGRICLQPDEKPHAAAILAAVRSLAPRRAE